MARGHFADVAWGKPAGSKIIEAADGALVAVYEVGTTTPVATLYAAATGGDTLSNPITAGDDGAFEFWLPARGDVDLAITHPDYTFETRTVQVRSPASEDIITSGSQSRATGLAIDEATLTDPVITGGQSDGTEFVNAVFTSATFTSPSMTSPTVTSGVMLVQGGTANAPSIARVGDTNTGVFMHSTADRMGLSAGGVEVQVDKGNDNPGAAFIWARRLDSGSSAAKGMLALHLGDSGSPVDSNNAANIAARSYLTLDSPDNPSAVLGDLYLQDGTGGFGVAVTGTARIDPGWTPSGESGVIGVLGSGVANRDEVNVWGGNLFATTPATITAPAEAMPQAVGLCGLEVDVGGHTDSTVASRLGVQVVANASMTVGGSGVDYGFRLMNKVGGAKWKAAYVVDGNDSDGTFPLRGDGTILCTTGIAGTGKGIDFSLTLFEDNIIDVPGFKITNNNPDVPMVAINNGTDFTPATLLHVRHSSSTTSTLATLEGDMANRLAGQLMIRGRTSTDEQLYLGVNTTNDYAHIQSVLNGTGGRPLVLQPIGGVTFVGDPTVQSPDTTANRLLHVGGVGGTSGTVCLRLDTRTQATTGSIAGYAVVNINGTDRLIHYYATS